MHIALLFIEYGSNLIVGSSSIYFALLFIEYG